ncbi:MAG: DUF2147 domain-containing protein [Treponema sp.]|nr:DUF2147 domain-containing protein [Treponema sp.]
MNHTKKIMLLGSLALCACLFAAEKYNYYESAPDEDAPSSNSEFDIDAEIEEDYFGSDPAEGYWIATNQRTGQPLCGWYMYMQDGVLYGEILSATGATAETVAKKAHKSYPQFPFEGKPNARPYFTTWMYGLKRKSEGKWVRGYIINPDDGACFRCNITYCKADGEKYKRDYLKMRGSLRGLTFLGVTQKWPAATFEEASSIK